MSASDEGRSIAAAMPSCRSMSLGRDEPPRPLSAPTDEVGAFSRSPTRVAAAPRAARSTASGAQRNGGCGA